MALRSLHLLGLLVLVACDAPGLSSKMAKSPNAQAQQQQPIGTARTTGADVAGLAGGVTQMPAVFTPGLSVSNAIAQACGITMTGNSVPSFEYDSAALAEADRKMLAEVAKCITEGALKGRSIVLVGRADARGEPEYNMTLGESRANTVHRYMVDLGVGRDHMKATSRGEMDATGKDDEGYARDRRVDIELAI